MELLRDLLCFTALVSVSLGIFRSLPSSPPVGGNARRSGYSGLWSNYSLVEQGETRYRLRAARHTTLVQNYSKLT